MAVEISLAQPDSLTNRVEMLVDGDIESGGYGGPVIKIANIMGQTGIFAGGEGGWIINHRFVVGAKAYLLTNTKEPAGLQNIIIGFACGGVLLKYIHEPNRLIHFSFESMVGFGGVYNDVGDYSRPHDPIDFTGDACFVFEPGLKINMNITDFFRIGAGLTYLFVNGVAYDPGYPYRELIGGEYKNISDSDLSGISGQFTLEFGAF